MFKAGIIQNDFVQRLEAYCQQARENDIQNIRSENVHYSAFYQTWKQFDVEFNEGVSILLNSQANKGGNRINTWYNCFATII